MEFSVGLVMEDIQDKTNRRGIIVLKIYFDTICLKKFLPLLEMRTKTGDASLSTLLETQKDVGISESWS